MPASPYPSTVTTWRQKREWRYNNKEAWNTYKQERRDAVKTANVYEPFNQVECDKLGGKKVEHVKVMQRKKLLLEQKYCPLSYPEDTTDSEDEDDNDNDGDDNDNDDDKKDEDNDNDDDKKDEDNSNDDDKKDEDNNNDDDKKDDNVNVDDPYGSGMVPDPIR